MSQFLPTSDPLDLLPANATALERELARLSAALDAIDPAVIETIWDAWACPAALLPWLAFALSVDHWDDAWPEVEKRQAVADSPAYHRRKGTVWAVLRLIERSGRPATLTEWWQRLPEGRRGTAIVHIEAELPDVWGVSRRIRPLLMTSKPKSRAVFLGVGPIAASSFVIGAGLLDETLTTIDPYAYAGEETGAALGIASGLLDETLTTIATTP